jgi:hypothetical protein
MSTCQLPTCSTSVGIGYLQCSGDLHASRRVSECWRCHTLSCVGVTLYNYWLTVMPESHRFKHIHAMVAGAPSRHVSTASCCIISAI